MHKRNLGGLGKDRDLAQRQEFIDCMVEGLSVDDTMVRLGIGRSTVYKWRQQWRVEGDSWNDPEIQRTRAKRFRKRSYEETKRHVIEAALENPEFGAARLAEFLGSRDWFSISTGTIHRYLKDVGLGRRCERLNCLYMMYQRGLSITERQLECIEKLDPFVLWGKQWRSKKPGQRLVVGMVRSTYNSPVRNSLLIIIVDAYDGRAFAAYGISQRPGELGVYSYLRWVIDWFNDRGFKVKELVTQEHYLWKRSFRACDVVPSFDEFLKSMKLTQRFDGTQGTKINPLIKHVWNTLRPYLFKELRGMCEPKTIEDGFKLNKAIQSFLDLKYPLYQQR